MVVVPPGWVYKRDNIKFVEPYVGWEDLIQNGVVTNHNARPVGITGSRDFRGMDDNLFIIAKRQMAKAKREKDWLTYNRIRKQDYGHPWELTQNFYLDNSNAVRKFEVTSGTTVRRFVGKQFAKAQNVAPGDSIWPTVTGPDYVEWGAYGTKAINATIPTNPASDAGQTIGELREGLPGISNRLRRSATLAERIAGKYVELEFGYKPLLGDVRSIAQTLKRSEDLLAQLELSSGQPIRRRFDFPLTSEIVNVDQGNSTPVPALSTPLTYIGRLARTTTTYKRYWFSAEYTFYFNRGKRARERGLKSIQNLDQLFGVNPSDPSLLWELTPWSWAADWVANTGDILRNVDALKSDSLVMKYGYIMCHKYMKYDYVLSNPGRDNLLQTFGTEFKMRKKASPYGFGLQPGDFTTRQKAILAALGIIHGVRT